MNKYVRTLQMPVKKKLLLSEAFLLLPVAWFVVRVLPFKWWSHHLGEVKPGEEILVDETLDTQALKEFGWAVRKVNRLFRGVYTCLMLAMAVQWMLSRRKISSTLVLGTLMEKDASGSMVMKAHAWLRAGELIVVGGHGGRYKALSTYLRKY